MERTIRRKKRNGIGGDKKRKKRSMRIELKTMKIQRERELSARPLCVGYPVSHLYGGVFHSEI